MNRTIRMRTCQLLRRTVLLSVLMLSLSGASVREVRADFVIDIDDAMMNPNKTISVNVYGRSSDLNPVLVAGYDLQLQIIDRTSTVLGVAPSGTLNFLDPQSTTDPSESSFIFAGTTETFYATRDPLNPLSMDTGATNTGLAEQSVTTRVLLARVELTQIQPIGDLSARGAYDLVFNVSNSQIYDSTFTPIDFSAGQSGRITLAISAVPEPGFLGLAMACVLPLAHFKRSRCRKAKVACT